MFLLINSLVFSFCALSLAFLLGSLVSNKEAINGIVNVIALGSSFLCGAFVPMEWLPSSVLTVTKVLPSYWYIKTNESLKTMEVFDWASVEPLLYNISIVLLFTFAFVFIQNIISKRRRKLS